MTLKNIANVDLQENFSNTAGPPDIVYTGDIGLSTLPDTSAIATQSTNVKAPGGGSGKKVCTTSLTNTFTATYPCPHTSATHTFVSGVGTISAGATKVTADGNAVMLLDDAGTCVGSWLDPSSNPVACGCNTKIANAGQSKAKAQ